MISPDHITRNDMAIDESVGESSYQYCLQVHLRNCTLVFFSFFLTNCVQWLFYLILVSAAVKTRIAPRAATKITFDSLLFSSITSITCLSLGQFKVNLVSGQFQYYIFVLFLQANSVMTEYSTSIAQKIIYIFACLGKHSKSKWQNTTTSINVDMENFKHELYDKHNAKGLKSHAHPQPAQSQPSCWWPTSSWRSRTYPCRTIWWVGSSAEFL